MSRNAERVKDPGPQSVADNDGDSPALLATTATIRFVCWLLIVPATCECISGTDLHRQFYVLPH